MAPIVSLPTTATSDLLAYAGQLFTDNWVLIALVIGIPLGFYIINKVISLVSKRAK